MKRDEAPIKIYINSVRKVYALIFADPPGYRVIAGALVSGGEINPIFVATMGLAERQAEIETS